MTKNARRKKSVRKRAADAGATFSAAQDNSHLDGDGVAFTAPHDAAPSEPQPVHPSSPIFFDYLGLVPATPGDKATASQPVRGSAIARDLWWRQALSQAEAGVAGRASEPPIDQSSAQEIRAEATRIYQGELLAAAQSGGIPFAPRDEADPGDTHRRLIAEAEARIAHRGPHPLVHADKPEQQAGLEVLSRRLGSTLLPQRGWRTRHRDLLEEGNRVHAAAERYSLERVASQEAARRSTPPAPMYAPPAPEGRG